MHVHALSTQHLFICSCICTQHTTLIHASTGACMCSQHSTFICAITHECNQHTTLYSHMNTLLHAGMQRCVFTHLCGTQHTHTPCYLFNKLICEKCRQASEAWWNDALTMDFLVSARLALRRNKAFRSRCDRPLGSRSQS